MNQPWTIDEFIEIKDNQLYLGPKSAIELANNHSTPLFVFSEKRIDANIKRLRKIEASIDCPLKICYATKANSLQGILEAVRSSGSDIEVNSGGELFLALRAGFRPNQIIFNGTSKTEKELSEAIDAGIYAIQADSVFEVEQIKRVSNQLGKVANVSLRMVPEIESETLQGLQTALRTSKFGMMPEEAIATFVRFANDKNLNLCGIHLHIGSQNPNPKPYADALIALFDCICKIYEASGVVVSHINLGGGFPVNYLRDDSNAKDIEQEQHELFATDLDPASVMKFAWAELIAHASKTEHLALLKDITLLIEPGRSVVADSGVCLTTVRNIKEREVPTEDGNRKDEWLLTDAGFNLLLSMETYKWYYHLISAVRPNQEHDVEYKVAGPLCDGGDVYFDIEGKARLPEHRLLPNDVIPGELLALLNCGAYSISQMFPYNGRELPAVVLLKIDGTTKIIRRRDQYEDLLINQPE